MIVTLLTDFGLADHYVAAMKGVILSRDPRITLVDVSHQVPPQDIGTAAYLLEASYRYFPEGTVNVVVVDPGVGSARRPLAIQCDGRFFVGPDNGTFAGVWRAASGGRVAREIDPAAIGSDAMSSTFHGRDVFAPAAASLATGLPIERLGPGIADIVAPEHVRPRMDAAGALVGRILHVDRFGNCVTDLRPTDFHGADWRRYRYRVAGTVIRESREYYSERAGESPFVLLGSTGYIEVAMDRRSAAGTLGLEVGDPVYADPSER